MLAMINFTSKRNNDRNPGAATRGGFSKAKGFSKARGFSRASGFSLIELLIAVLVMAVGILGVAGLQVVSLQQNRSALFRAEAIQLGNGLLDRIRANPFATYAPVEIDAIPLSTARDCITNGCSTDQMAEFDIASWKCSLNPQAANGTTYTICTTLGITKNSAASSSSLPLGKGSLVVDEDTNTYTVTVQWVDNRAGNTKSIVLHAKI